MTRPRVLVILLVIHVGCEQPAGKAPVDAGGGSPVKKTDSEEIEYREPIAFEELPLAADSSYESLSARQGTEPGELREFTKLNIKFCWCPPGTFRMGSPHDAPHHLVNETQFDATLSRGFWMQQTELTQEQYEALMGSNPSFYKGPRNPVDSVTWTEAAEFCRRLSELPPEKKVGNVFRLPTEAEWEYACRAGSTTAFFHGEQEEGLEEYGWYSKNAARTTHPVGEKKANAWGLFDMHGNVMEWCGDHYADYPRSPATDPRGPDSGDKRVLRGGSWFHVAMWLRSSHREAYPPSARYVGLGFRLVATETAEAK